MLFLSAWFFVAFFVLAMAVAGVAKGVRRLARSVVDPYPRPERVVRERIEPHI
jgi:hypothetical protein